MCHKSQRSHFQDGLDKLCQSVAKVRWSDDHSDHSESHTVVQAGHLVVTLTTTCQHLLSFDLGRSLHSNSDMFRKHLWSFCQMWTSAWRTQALARVSAPCVGGKKVEVQLGSFGLSLLSTRSPRFVLECKTQVIHIHLALKDEAATWELIWIYLGYSRYSRYVLYRERAHVEVCRECGCWNVKKQSAHWVCGFLLFGSAVSFCPLVILSGELPAETSNSHPFSRREKTNRYEQ